MTIYKKFNEFKKQGKLDPRYYHYFDELPTKLMGVDTNTKIIKNQKLGFLTGIIHMQPADVSGYTLCTHYEQAGCKKPCLVSVGRGVMGPVIASRLRKSWFWMEYRKEFESLLRKEIDSLVRIAKRDGLIPLVRLNGTSDIVYERKLPGIFSDYPNVQFYDYTKSGSRLGKTPSNYDLTFSYSANLSYQGEVIKAINNGSRIAVVFKNQDQVNHAINDKQGLYIHDKWFPLVSGDDSDVRHLDDNGVAVALYFKGSKKLLKLGLESKFVIDITKMHEYPGLRFFSTFKIAS